MGSDGSEMHENGLRWHVLLVRYSQGQKDIVKMFALRDLDVVVRVVLVDTELWVQTALFGKFVQIRRPQQRIRS